MKCCRTLSQTLNLVKIAFSVIVLTACSPATWAAPVISSVSPRSFRPAQTTEVTLVGTELTSPLNAWTTFAADVKVLAIAEGADDNKTAKLAITLTEKAAVGVGGLVVSNTNGVSQLFLVMVDDLPATTDGGKNNTAGTAQGVDQPTNIIGTSSGTTHDYYSFQAKAAEVISFDVYASRIGSSMDPVLRLLTAAGDELAYAPNEQTPYSGWTKEMHSNGQIESLVQYKDGKRDGLDAGWYENGQKQWEGNYKDGLKTEWFENGQKELEANYKDGELDGLETGWYQNGQKEYEGNWKDGKQDGLWIFYNEDGTEKSRLTFKDGELVED